MKLSMISRYAQSVVYNPRDDMSIFVITRFYNLMREKWHTAMLHDDMNLSRLMLYAQSI